MDYTYLLIPLGGIISLISMFVYEKYLQGRRRELFSLHNEDGKELFAQELCPKLMREHFWCRVGMITDLVMMIRAVAMYNFVFAYFLLLAFSLLFTRYRSLSKEYVTYRKFLFHKKCEKLFQGKL